jgi:hypothetical protein
MKIAANILGAFGLCWVAYFWLSVFWYPRVRLPLPPTLNAIVQITLLAAAFCALAGKIVSKRWWAGIALAMITLIIIYARVRP